MNRQTLSKYLKDSGLEIGPGPHPWPVTEGTKVTYIGNEKRPNEHLDVVDDGELLITIDDNSQDFVVSSHVLEHFPSPLNALETWYRVLKSGGYVVMAVPNKDETFDKPRRITPLNELVSAYNTELGRRWFGVRQWLEWGKLFHKLEGDELSNWVDLNMSQNKNIHFPVWDPPTYKEFIDHACKLLGFELVEHHHVGFEFLTVLRKP